jgi:hypothetical protein
MSELEELGNAAKQVMGKPRRTRAGRRTSPLLLAIRIVLLSFILVLAFGAIIDVRALILIAPLVVLLALSYVTSIFPR